MLYHSFNGSQCFDARICGASDSIPTLYFYFNTPVGQSTNFDITASNLCCYKGEFTHPHNHWSYDNFSGNPYNGYFILESLYRHYKPIAVYDAENSDKWQRLLCIKPVNAIAKYTLHGTLSVSSQQHGPVVSFIATISEGEYYGKITILHAYKGNGSYTYIMKGLRFAYNTTDGYVYLEVKHTQKVFNYYILNWRIDINYTSWALPYIQQIYYWNQLAVGNINVNDVLVPGSETTISFT